MKVNRIRYHVIWDWWNWKSWWVSNGFDAFTTSSRFPLARRRDIGPVYLESNDMEYRVKKDTSLNFSRMEQTVRKVEMWLGCPETPLESNVRTSVMEWLRMNLSKYSWHRVIFHFSSIPSWILGSWRINRCEGWISRYSTQSWSSRSRWSPFPDALPLRKIVTYFVPFVK